MIKRFDDFINEDTNTTELNNNMVTYNKYKGKITSMFVGINVDLAKVTQAFDDFISKLPENEKGASDLLRSLYSVEKAKVDIKNLETKKKEIDLQISTRLQELQKMKSELK